MSATIELPKEVIKILGREARKRGLSLAELLINSVAKSLDSTTRVEVYLKLHERYVEEARELSDKGNLLQAGEKYWGAVTTLLNAIGEKEGLPHYAHKDLKEISIYLSEKTGDSEYTRLFSSVETLHANFYHRFLRERTFAIHREDAEKLITKLKKYLGL